MPGPYFVSQAELDQIREDQELIIGEIGGTGTIRRPTYTDDNNGGYTATFAEQTLVPMRVWISSGPNGTSEESRFWGEQELASTDAFLTVEWDTDIQIKDQITYDGRQWKVVGLQISDTFRTATRARLESMRY